MIWTGVVEDTPLGNVWVATGRQGVVAVEIEPQPQAFTRALETSLQSPIHHNLEKTAEACRQIQAYLVGDRRNFSLDIDWTMMTAFQRQVLQLVVAIPYGRTTTYSELAHCMGRPRAARAVGRANATNPMPLVIPCHRVIGRDGQLRGYGAPGGLATKAWLLALEKRRPDPQQE